MKFFFLPAFLLTACGGAPFGLMETPPDAKAPRETAAIVVPDADASPAEAAPPDAPTPPLWDADGGATPAVEASLADHTALACPFNGGGPFAFVPASVAFGDVKIGAQPVLAEMRLTNEGDCLAQISLSGGGIGTDGFNDYSNCGSALLWPGDSCVFTITFSPEKLGPASVTSMATVNRMNLPLSATGNGVP
jgi:hypothetical protein